MLMIVVVGSRFVLLLRLLFIMERNYLDYRVLCDGVLYSGIAMILM